MNKCYLCGADASVPLRLSDTFTSHNLAKCPESSYFCSRCEWVLNLRCWYWNEDKKKWSPLWGRNWSWLLSSDVSFPVFDGERTATNKTGNDTMTVVKNLPTRDIIRSWLINPPAPPFTVAIAVSGQKHILPFSLEANSQEHFPVLFEHDILYLNRSEFIKLLAIYEALMQLNFSKTEIDSGNYRSDRLANAMATPTANPDFWELEDAIAKIRKTKMMELIGFVAIKNHE